MRAVSIRRVAKVALGAAMLVLAGFTLRRLDFHSIVSDLRVVSPAAIALALGLSLVQVLAQATRFWAIFPSKSRPAWALVARAFGLGQLVNTYTPGRAGDVVKVIAIARDSRPSVTHGPAADAAGVLLADKALDVISLALLALLLLACGHGLLAAVSAGAHPPLAAGLIALGVIAIGAAVLRAWPAARAKVGVWAAATLHVVRGLLTPARMGRALGLAFLGWAAEVTILVVLAAPMGVHLTFAQATTGLIVLNLGIAVPVSVANIGAFEAATVVGLVPFGASTSQAIAIGTLHHAIQIVGVLIFALAFWVSDRMARRRGAKQLRLSGACVELGRNEHAVCV